jgi:hypothetical protein
MGEVKQLNIRKVSKFDSDFIFSMTIKVKAIYADIYEKKTYEAIISFLNGRDIGVVKGDKLVMDIGDVTFSSIIFSKITEEYVTIKTPSKSKVKSDIKNGVDVYDDITLDIFKNKICVREV